MSAMPPINYEWGGDAMVPMRNGHIVRCLPPRNYLMECFEYHADGYLIWRERPAKHFYDVNVATQWNQRYAHNRAGYKLQTGYRSVSVDGERLLEHRLIHHMLIAPITPHQSIDHIDHDRTNNRIENLRACTHAENLMNQPGRRSESALPKHVYWSKRERKFKVQMRACGKIHFLGTFSDLSEATKAAVAGRNRLHGTFANEGRCA